MKRFFLLFVIYAWTAFRTSACGFFYDPDIQYYNLFMQEAIDDPQYFPFLLAPEDRFFSSQLKKTVKNENIEAWEHYLGLSYEDSYYLVFESNDEELNDLIEGKKEAVNQLAFATPAFIKKHKQALKYLVYAKYLEPFMAISKSMNSGWYYYKTEKYFTASDLDFAEVVQFLELGWRSTKDKELKLRYGYQLVRFAHYNQSYDIAIQFFDKYVESLKHRSAMYYHALAHKAGAERGIGNVLEANLDYFKVFVHSRDLKEMAVTSIQFTEDVDFQDFLSHAVTEKEKCDAYLLLGWHSFTNPMNEAEKIASLSPDAIQVKVLISRAINQIERELMPVEYYYWGYPKEKMAQANDLRYPMLTDQRKLAFLEQVHSFVNNMVESSVVKEKDYWYLTSAYLHFLQKDFEKTKSLLALIQDRSELYGRQKNNLFMYIYICEQPLITPAVEMKLINQYGNVFTRQFEYDISNYFSPNPDYTTQQFLQDVLANRYYLQKEYAKSFLMSHDLTTLEMNPQLELLNDIEAFFQKENKNAWENHLVSKLMPTVSSSTQIQNYINHMRGIIYLTKGDLRLAHTSFSNIPEANACTNLVFGYNQIECFECADSVTMATDYVSDFSFIANQMSLLDLTESLLKLEKIANGSTERAAKANYLLGNFYYNLTAMGYYRNFLRFMDTNSFIYKRYSKSKKPDIYNDIYFKYYETYYDNPVDLAYTYLDKAYKMASKKELRARIAFALSKCEQEEFEYSDDVSVKWPNTKGGVLISDRKYFKELMKYQETAFFEEVKTNCKYFSYYVNKQIR